MKGLLPTLRFGRAWIRGRADVQVDEVAVAVGDIAVASRFRRRDAPGGPGWILLHGMTRTGRRHPSLVRFARAVAAAGTTVVVPEVPAWVGLRLAPERTGEAVEAGLRLLADTPGVRGRPGLMGFSFGGPQVLRAAADPATGARLSCVAAVGGYGDLERTVSFLLTGVHRWEGREHRVRPDPYGRWIVAANYLAAVPGMDGARDVARALRDLAVHAGDRAIESWDPALDPVKDHLAGTLPPERRALFRYFAPPAGRDPPASDAVTEDWARALTRAGLAVDPSLDLPHALEIPVPVLLLHGRNDPLIPSTESLRMARRIRAPEVRVLVTRLFAHSAGDPGPDSPLAWGREAARLGATLRWLMTPR